MSILRNTSALAVAFAAFSLACAHAPEPEPAATSAVDVRAAIDSQFSKLFDAYRRRDAAAFAAFYSDDAEMEGQGMPLRGRVAIQNDFARGLAGVTSVASDTAWTDEFLASGDHAIQMGRVVWTETDKGKPPFRTKLTFALAWRKDAAGAWRITRDINFETVLK